MTQDPRDPIASDPSSVPASPGAATAPTVRPRAANDRLAALFPDLADVHPPRRRRSRRLGALIAVLVVALVGSVLIGTQAFGSESANYRTATAGTHDVDAVLSGVATIEPVSQATVAFPVSGTVGTVDVELGDTVSIGQTLAGLDPVSLVQSLHDKEAALATAELNLSKALAGETVSNGTSGSGANPSGGTSTRNVSYTGTSTATVTLAAATAAPGSTSTSSDAIAQAQQAVLAAQKQVDTALAAAEAALENATTVCAAVDGSDVTGSTGNTAADDDPITACQTALADVLTAQKAVATAQQTLAGAATALDTLLLQEASNPGTNSGTGNTGGTGNAGGSAPSGSDSATSSSPSAADLIAYQKAVDAAAAEVAVAEQAVAQTTVVSPIAGTVVAVNLAVGDTVSAASSTANIVIAGAGGYEATTTVSVDDIPDVAIGQTATVVPDGSHEERTGKVVAISVVADADSSSSGTNYRVTIALTGDTSDLKNGSTGSVSIVTDAATAALAVPTSAVTTSSSRHTVQVLENGSTRTVTVKVGAVGSTWTEITSGLDAGDVVVLADVHEALPSGATSTSSNSGNRSGNAGGGTFGGGNFPAGGPPSFGGNR